MNLSSQGVVQHHWISRSILSSGWPSPLEVEGSSEKVIPEEVSHKKYSTGSIAQEVSARRKSCTQNPSRGTADH